MKKSELRQIIREVITEKKLGFNRGPEYSEETEDLFSDFQKSVEMLNKEFGEKSISSDSAEVQEITFN